MPSLSEQELLLALLSLAMLLVLARGAGELARRLGQPEVLGELLAGFVLGPSVFGALFPAVRRTLFLDPAVGHALSAFSWIGAILLLLLGGMEVDLTILRAESKPGALAAGFAIAPALAAGTAFAWLVLGQKPPGAFFLGIVLSVTAVSVVAKILIEREVLRRRYAQVLLAAGVASEILVWLLVSVVSATHSGSPALAALRSTLAAVGFFVVTLTLGRRGVFWAMRRVADQTSIIAGQLSLVLVLAFVAAAITQALGLHALLGAFVIGVLLGQAPRANEPLLKSIQTLASGLFAPIFFALAGMRVDIFQLGTPTAALAVLGLLVVATLAKVLPVTLGTRLGGLPVQEAALVGVGLNLKGGTDVIVAIIGVELGLLSNAAYTMYTLVAILTVLFSPPLLDALARRAPPAAAEQERLGREEAGRRAYLPKIERVLVPIVPQLLPAVASAVVGRVAETKREQHQVFDITQFVVEGAEGRAGAPATAHALAALGPAGKLANVELTERHADRLDPLPAILAASADHDLIAIGARRGGDAFSPGPLQDAIVHGAQTDVLVVGGEERDLACGNVRRLLVPTNGMEYSMAAGDIAAYFAKACGAEVVVLSVAHAEMGDVARREQDHRRLRDQGSGIVQELAFRLRRVGVTVTERVEVGEHPAESILRELATGRYQVLVLGALDQGTADRPYLGGTVETLWAQAGIPTIVLVSRGGSRERPT